WPSNRPCVQDVHNLEKEGKDLMTEVDPTCAPAPTYLANTPLETYSQDKIPLASSSCMACHGQATTQHVPATASDYDSILEQAHSARRRATWRRWRGPAPRARQRARPGGSHDRFHAPQNAHRRRRDRGWRRGLGEPNDADGRADHRRR